MLRYNDLFMELSASCTIPLADRVTWFTYSGYYTLAAPDVLLLVEKNILIGDNRSMKTRFLLILLVTLTLGAGALVVMKPGGGVTDVAHEHLVPTVAAPSTPDAQNQAKPRIPAYQEASEVGNLPPTLPASEFVGKTQEAYEVARNIPDTLAQLPCYCECDKAFGHKSLHTCFVDDHASHCAVCVDEALLAYKLQKGQKLTPDQVREKIIEKYSVEHRHE
ncbi:hypothetical protein BH20ACI3_BH20ACI3_27280 [soil metagenome]